MALIHAHGLFKGERMRACSDMARLYWPYFFAASNSCGRLEINIDSIIDEAFGNFKIRPKREEVIAYLKEYNLAHLLFFYVAEDGSTWGQWDVRDEDLPRWRNRDASRSPAPPAPALAAWKKEYEDAKRARSLAVTREFTRVHAEAPQSAHGVGVGVGVGVGGGKAGDGKTAPTLPVTFTVTEPPEDLGATALARGMLDELEIPASLGMVDIVRLAIEAKAKKGGGLAAAYKHILGKAQEAKATGPPKSWTFWFRDAQYNQGGQNGKRSIWEDASEAVARSSGEAD